ncbi:MAG TPA: hypothetical protein VFS05_09375 [Gemmatimonadaceae bacterium]|nr:hypothetical protein [Gemmatimonadaceae bacterium]
MTARPAPRALWLALAAVVACGGGDESARAVRGRGLEAAALPAGEQAEIYDAVLRAAFDIGPGMTLLVSPRQLPATAGVEGGPPLSPEVIRALEQRRVVQGTCAPPTAAKGSEAPRCEAPALGYLVRLSPIFRSPGDTLRVHLRADHYALTGGAPVPTFHFEKAYELVRRDDRWRVVREGRVNE